MRRLSDGEASFRAPWMFLGYWSSTESLTSQWIGMILGTWSMEQRHSWLFVGAKGSNHQGRDEHQPHDIEQCLQNVFGITQCVVLGVPKHGDEQIVCWIAGDETTALEKQELNAALEKHLGRKYLLDVLINLPELPRNLNGKLDKPRLRLEWEMMHG